MKIRTPTALSLLVLMAACGNQAVPNEPAAEDNSEARIRAEARFTKLAECSSTMKAVGALYSSIAAGQSGSAAEEMLETARVRTEAGVALREMAVQMAPTLDRTAADVDRVIAEMDDSLRRSSQNTPFEDFATQTAGRADECAPLLTSGS